MIPLKKMDYVRTPHGRGTVAGVGPEPPWHIDYEPTGTVFVWVVYDEPFRPSTFKNDPACWRSRGGWLPDTITPLVLP